MSEKHYKYKCKDCGHEYVAAKSKTGDNGTYACPECGTINQPIGSFIG